MSTRVQQVTQRRDTRMQERTDIIEKAVDCLRIVTTGNDANKRALVEIPIAVPALVALLSDDPSQARWVLCRSWSVVHLLNTALMWVIARHAVWQVITERAVAVLGNLSTSPEYFQALRDAGAPLPTRLRQV